MRTFMCVSCVEGCKRYIDTLGLPAMHGHKCPEGHEYICNFVELIWLECKCCGHQAPAHKFPDISQDPDDPAYCEPYCPICLSSSIVTGKNDDHISIVHVARELGGMQNQYISHYLGGLGGYPDLSEGIRWYEEMKGNYHSIRIHKDDIDEFIMRLAQARNGSIVWYDVPDICEKAKDGKHLTTTHEDEVTLYCVECGITLGKVIQ